MSIIEPKWWKHGTVYQVYPASYKDSNGDGIGDIPGIISTLGYLKDLGIDILYVCPIYDSPQYDMGYDISNYEDIYPPYGTLQDAENLIQECHIRGMKIIFDLVINHTSSEHAWFKESRSSVNSPKRDWYIWRPPKHNENGDREPPNNWRSHFGGSAWEWDESTQEYYLHLFAPQQPDLNWENPVCRSAIYASAITFWLDRGIDGFRVDTANMYSKATGLPDAPILEPDQEFQFDTRMWCNGPHIHEYLRELNSEALAGHDVFTVGELPHTPNKADVLEYIHSSDPQLSMVFQFDIVDLGHGKTSKFDLQPFTISDFKSCLNNVQTLILGDAEAWTTTFLENHDQARSISRFASASPENRVKSGKLIAMLLATLTGTLFIYQGQEIGMLNVDDSWGPEDFRDIETVNYLDRLPKDDPEALKEAMDAVRKVGRDNGRTPMQWDSTSQAGFTTGTPWIKVIDNYTEINVANEQASPDTVYSFWKDMLRLRSQHKTTMVYGDFSLLASDDDMVFYVKIDREKNKVVVGLNFSDQKKRVIVPHGYPSELKWEILAKNGTAQIGVLGPWEGKVWGLPSGPRGLDDEME
jgi:oligo-1,6-glucosidase